MTNYSGANETNIKITFEDFDKDNLIVFIEKNGKNIGLTLGLFDFQDWMEYWDIPTNPENRNGKIGFVFNKKDCTSVEMKTEIINFMKEYNLDYKD